MLNGTRHALARIPLRWMIRECFQAETGIIFDADALKHEIGLDMGESGPTPKAPELPSHTAQQLAKPEVVGVSARVWGTVTTPYRWLFGGPSYKVDKDRAPEGEAQEELNDAVSPSYDQLNIWYWKWMQDVPGM